MFLGRRQLGQWINISCQCTDEDDTPSLPTEPPMLTIRRASDGVAVYTKEMPIIEKQGTAIGYFIAKVFLGTGFGDGLYTVEMAYQVGSFGSLVIRSFEILPGGNPNGQVIGMAFYRRPSRTNVVYQVEAGRIMRGSNPSIN